MEQPTNKGKFRFAAQPERERRGIVSKKIIDKLKGDAPKIENMGSISMLRGQKIMKSRQIPEDICRLAKMIIEKHADHAAEYAMGHALEMRGRGDLNGEIVWLKVFDNIQALQYKKFEHKILH